MSTIDHKAEALAIPLLRLADDTSSADGRAIAAGLDAVKHATLCAAEQTAALVTQQRIRNNMHAASVYGSNPALWPSEIREALGLS